MTPDTDGYIVPSHTINSIGDVPFTHLLIAVVVFVMGLKLSVSQFADFITPDNGLFTPSLSITILVLFQNLLMLAVVWFFVLKRNQLTWRNLGLKSTTASWCFTAILFALPLVASVGFINFGVMQLVNDEFVNPQLQSITPEGFSWNSFLIIIIATGLIAPFAEEMVFRGLILGWLDQRFGKFVAILVSSVLFGSVHGIPMLIPALTAAGISFAIITYRSKSLWPAIILHATFNMFMTSTLFYALSQGLELPG